MQKIAKQTWFLTLVGWALLGHAMVAQAYVGAPVYSGSQIYNNPYGGYSHGVYVPPPPGGYYSRTTTTSTTYYGYPQQGGCGGGYCGGGGYPYPGYVYPGSGCYYGFCQPYPYQQQQYRYPKQIMIGLAGLGVFNMVY